MRVLLALALVAIMAGEVEARLRGGVWKQDRIPVWDSTAAEWQPFVKRAVHQFNRAMPKNVPRLIYHARIEQPCDDLPVYGDPGGIRLCLDPDLIGAESRGNTRYIQSGRVLYRAMIRLWPDASETLRDTLICHELMHAVTTAPDSRGGWDRLDTSCVRGALDAPGSWDVGFARRLYRQHRHH